MVTRGTRQTLLEVVFYCANKRLLLMKVIGIADLGGTIIIHVRHLGKTCDSFA